MTIPRTRRYPRQPITKARIYAWTQVGPMTRNGRHWPADGAIYVTLPAAISVERPCPTVHVDSDDAQRL